MNLRLAPGDILVGRYRILSFHGSGGMQEVYLTRDLALDREVVLKTPKAGVVDRRFRRGAEMGARITHANVAATLDYYEDDQITFLVEEYVPGYNLKERLDGEFEFMDPALAAHVMHHIAKSLAEAHRAQICHRDLKPSNIVTSSDPGLSVIKLTDFGIAKLAISEIAAEMDRFNRDENTLTSSNTLLGAVPYMAPECWSNWRDAGQPSDVWAFGCIAYQLLAGAPPFGTGRSAIAAVARAETTGVNLQRPPWFGRHASTRNLEDKLWDIVTRCIRVAVGERPTAMQLVDEFDAFCYPTTTRLTGVIETYPHRYAGGGIGNFGFVRSADRAQTYYFHASEFYGRANTPAVGDHVNFCAYLGAPRHRASPVLRLRPPPSPPPTF